jgi:hypothetical protein
MIELIVIFITSLPGNMSVHETRVVSPVESMEFCQNILIPDILRKYKEEPDRKMLSLSCLETKERESA